MFEIATQSRDETAILPKSHGIDDTQRVDLRNGVRAERFHRQIIANIEAHEDPDDLKKYMAAETLILDAMFMEWPEYAAAIDNAFEGHIAVLKAGLESQSKQGPQSGFNGISF